MDNTDKFSGKAEVYAKSRPSYSKGLIDYIIKKMGENITVADIGSGTGIFAEEFLKRNCKVFCVEPNEDMQNTARKLLSEYTGFVPVCGTDANTSLYGNSVDLVTAAQAFHWFDVKGFKSECNRILKTNGIVAIVYNHRATNSEFVKENAEICRRHCPDFKGFSNKFNGNAMSKINFLYDNKYEKLCFENNLTYTKELFIQRMISASYSPSENDFGYRDYVSDLERLFDKYSKSNILLLPNETIAYIGTV